MPRKSSKVLDAIERRNTLLHILSQARMWMDSSALRRFVSGKRQVVEQDLRKLAELGHIETASLKTFNPELDRCQIVMMARSKN